jgi:hypothetical protein
MRTWYQKLGLFVGGLVGLGSLAASAQAQMPPNFSCGPGCGGSSAPQVGDPNVASSLPNDGSPNAFLENEAPCCWSNPLVWGGADYVFGFTRKPALGVPLATTSTNPNAATGTGAIGQPSTLVLFGLEGPDLQNPQGIRATVGVSPTRDWMVPLEVVYLYMHQKTDAFSQESNADGDPLLARPIVVTQSGKAVETAIDSSFPGTRAGGINIDSSLQLWGVQALGVIRTDLQWGDDSCGCAITLPVGYRYLNLNEVLDVASNTTALSAAVPVSFLGNTFPTGSQTSTNDTFKANNQFHGGEFGIRLETRVDRWSFTFDPRISIGATDQTATIGGASTVNPSGGGAPQTAVGGLLAVASNSGQFSRERFTYLPEGTFTVGWDCFRWMRIQAGYNVVYWPNVIRAGSEVSNTVDLRQVPTSRFYEPGFTAPTTTFVFKDSSFFMQDVSIGVVFSF